MKVVGHSCFSPYSFLPNIDVSNLQLPLFDCIMYSHITNLEFNLLFRDDPEIVLPHKLSVRYISE